MVASPAFELVGEIEDVEIIAVGSSIHDLKRLREQYGAGRWRKLKGAATVRLLDGTIRRVEIHCYEAHGIGEKKLKIKRYLR